MKEEQKEVPERNFSFGEIIIIFLKSPRGKAIIKLIIILLIFFIIRLLDYRFGTKEKPNDYVSSSSSSSSSDVIVENTYERNLERLKTENYSFYIEINNNGTQTNVIGERKEERIIGHVNSIYADQFTVENNVVYNTTNGKKTVDEKLLDQINYNYFYASVVINLISQITPEVMNQNINETTYLYKLSNQSITISYSKNIEKITIEELTAGIKYEIYYQLLK